MNLSPLKRELLALGLDEKELQEVTDLVVQKLSEKNNSSLPKRTKSKLLEKTKKKVLNTQSEGLEFKIVDKKSLIQSLLENENQYLKNLRCIVEDWLTPLRKFIQESEPTDKQVPGGTKKKLFTSQELNRLFSNIEILYNIHHEFHEELKSAVPSQEVGTTFNKWIPFFKMYTEYVNNWVYANDIYNKFKETPFFKSQKKQIGLDLIDLLALPLPRIEYYHETLKKIETQTSSISQDYQDIKLAIEKIVDVSSCIVDAQESYANIEKFIKIQKSLQGFPGELDVPGRNFKKEGDLCLIEKEEKKLLHFFLFSDILIGAKLERGIFKFKLQINLKKAEIVKKSVSAKQLASARLSGSRRIGFPRSSKNEPAIKNALLIITEDRTPITLTAASAEEKEQWKADLGAICDYYYSKRVFGIPLWELVRRKDKCLNGIPLILHQIFNSFNESAYKTEGLFRIAASHGAIESIRQKLDDDQEVSFDSVHPHLKANLIKIFLRELPEPLIPYHCYEDFVNATLKASESEADSIKAYSLAISKMPTPNRILLRHLFQFLHTLGSYAEFNKMNYKGIGLVIEPNVLRKKVSQQNRNQISPDLLSLGTTGTIEQMLHFTNELFPPSTSNEEIPINIPFEDEEIESEQEETEEEEVVENGTEDDSEKTDSEE